MGVPNPFKSSTVRPIMLVMQADRRYGRRLPTTDPIDVLWRDQSGQPQHSIFHLADISICGAAVRAERPVHVGATVSLGYQNKTVIGKVRHCARKGADFMLGIEFQDDCEWAVPQN